MLLALKVLHFFLYVFVYRLHLFEEGAQVADPTSFKFAQVKMPQKWSIQMRWQWQVSVPFCVQYKHISHCLLYEETSTLHDCLSLLPLIKTSPIGN